MGSGRSLLKMLATMGDVTVILNAVQRGDQQAADELIPLVY
jgi:hypothetical protein